MPENEIHYRKCGHSGMKNKEIVVIFSILVVEEANIKRV
jgi:hypothetical protein